MRAGWNPRLAELLQRPDPVARVIPEAVVTAAEDVRRRRDEWEEGSVSGTVRYLDSGGVRLEGQVAEYVTQTTRGGWIRELGADDFHAARLLWGGRRDGAITRIRAWLHPRFDGAQPQEVAWWECRIWALARYRRAEFGPTVYLSLAQLASSRVEAGGGEGEVLFDFAAPVDPTVIYPEDVSGIGTYPNPVTFVQIVALKADGSPAGNVGWAIDPDRTSLTQGPGVTLTGWTLERAGSGPGESPFLGWWKDDVAPEPVPYIIVEHDDLDPATITFSGAAQIDLGAPPPPGTAVEFVAQGEAPAGSALLFEVLADNGTTWVPVRDGQTTDDLPGVSPRRTYAMRVTLTPSPAGDVSPIARDIGARTVRRWTLLGLADVRLGTSWGFDPLTFRGSIPTATVTLIRGGARDYSDFATELLSQHAPGDIEIRLWVGSERLPRSDWLLLDVFELEDYDPQPAAIHLHCISPAARLRAAQLPPLDEVRKVREPLVYTNQSLAAVYADLLDGQIALPERYRGPGVPDTSTLVSKRITEGDGKTELDAIAYLAGGAVIASQGVVKWIDVAGAAGLRAVFPAEEITVLGASPGLRQATPEWIVPWDWSDEEGRFRGEVPVHHLPALEAVRAGRLDAPQRLEDGIARWIHEEAHARRIGLRHVTWFGAGLIQLHFRTEYPHPYLEPGDLVLVELRDFVARDPNTARALRGQLWAIATVNEVADPLGREFLAWVRSYADLIPTAEAYERIGDVAPEVLAIERSVDKDGRVSLVVYGNTMAGYIRAAATTGSSFPDDQVDAAPAVPGRVAAFNDLIQIGPADVARISVRAYERSDGQGAASEIVHAIAVHPRIGTPAVQARVQLNSSRDAANVFLTPDSPIGEALRVHLRDSDAAGAPVWSLVQGNGSATPRFVADGTEIGPDSWFYNGSQWAQKLSAVALSRDQIRRIYVQAEGQLSGLRSSWIPIPLELRAQPWLESVTAAWNDAGDSIEVTAIGGAHCQSARYELSKDGFATAPAYQRDVSLSDNERKTEVFLIPESDRRASWRARVIPHNGPLTSGQASGLAGAPQETAVPPLPPEVEGAVDVLVIMPRWVYSGADAHLELVITYGSAWRSLRVEYQYSSVPGGQPDTRADYVFDLQAGGGNTIHLVEDAQGLIRFWTEQDPSPRITVTPYEGPNGTGRAGTPHVIQPEELSQSGAVGGRVGTTGDPTVYQADRILFQHPTSLGFRIDRVNGIPVVRLDGVASVQQGGTGLSSSPGKGDLLVGDGGGGYTLLSRGSSGSVLRVTGDVVNWGPVPSHTHTFGDITGQAKPSQLGIGADGAIVKKAKDSDSFISVTGQPGWVLTWDDLAGWEASPPPVPLPVTTANNRFLQSAGGGWQASSWGLPPGPPPERRYLYHPGGTGGTAAWGLPTWDELQNKPSVAITTQSHTISGLWTFRRGNAYPSLRLGREGFDDWGIGPSALGGVQRFMIRDENTGAAWEFYVTGRINGPGEGNVGIGGDAVPTYKLSVAGSVRATAGFFDTSDVALKRDIVPLSRIADPQALLLALDPVRFRWRGSGQSDIGFVAQGTPAVFLDLDGLAIAYHRIVAVLVAGWQDHERRLRALELALEEVSRGLA